MKKSLKVLLSRTSLIGYTLVPAKRPVIYQGRTIGNTREVRATFIKTPGTQLTPREEWEPEFALFSSAVADLDMELVPDDSQIVLKRTDVDITVASFPYNSDGPQRLAEFIADHYIDGEDALRPKIRSRRQANQLAILDAAYLQRISQTLDHLQVSSDDLNKEMQNDLITRLWYALEDEQHQHLLETLPDAEKAKIASLIKHQRPQHSQPSQP